MDIQDIRDRFGWQDMNNGEETITTLLKLCDYLAELERRIENLEREKRELWNALSSVRSGRGIAA